jgi:hypothetical protein
MVTSSTSVDGLTADFPHPILKKIHGNPTMKEIVEMHKNCVKMQPPSRLT